MSFLPWPGIACEALREFKLPRRQRERLRWTGTPGLWEFDTAWDAAVAGRAGENRGDDE